MRDPLGIAGEPANAAGSSVCADKDAEEALIISWQLVSKDTQFLFPSEFHNVFLFCWPICIAGGLRCNVANSVLCMTWMNR